jgi:Protein of unknown function (DUF2852)
MTTFAGRFEGVPWPIWIALAMLGFWFFGPLGLAILAFVFCSRMLGGCGMGFGRPHNWIGPRAHAWPAKSDPSSNQAFDEYRTATLRRLQDEQQEFHGFLAHLRAAKDRAEFDQFMGERRAQSGPRG